MPRSQAARPDNFTMFVSDLDIILRAGNIDHLVLAGITTSGVVLTTLRQAADLEFAFAVLADGCLDSDPEVHRYWWKRCSPPDGRHHRR